MTKSFRTTSFWAAALGAVLMVLCAAPLAAQTARVEGIVTDNTGAAVPGATVTATNTGTNASRVDVTNAEGSYSMPALPVGDYRVTVDLSGFKQATTPVTLTVNQVARLDFGSSSAACRNR